MLLAVLESSDLAIIALLIFAFRWPRGGSGVVSAYLRPADRDRLERVEQKLDLILTHFGIDSVPPPPKSLWQELADDPGQKIAAIKGLPRAAWWRVG